jgi:hypothetical protein
MYGVPMAIVKIRRASSGPEAYDATINAGTAKDNPPKGLIIHTAGMVDGMFQVIDVWESAEDADRFERGEAARNIAPVHGENYRVPEPTTYELHNIIRG